MFLEGKHNRPLDHLISILLTKVVPYFVARHRNQQFGFQGPDLEVQYRMDTHSRSLTIPLTAIEEVIPSHIYLVYLHSNPSCQYNVNIEAYTCECAAFPLTSFCKHFAAVQLQFPDDQEHPFVSIFTPATTTYPSLGPPVPIDGPLSPSNPTESS